MCSTAPMHGAAMYSSRCGCEFHMNVATRSPCFDAERLERRGSASTRWATSP